MNDTAWMHSKRMNAARGAKSADEVAAEQARLKAWTTPPERKIPSALDPRTFDHRVGFDEDEDSADPVLSRVREAFSFFHNRLTEWRKREETIYSDPYELPEKKKMTVARMVRDESDKNLDHIDRAYKSVSDEIENIDRDINKAFRHKLPREDAAEIRAHLRGLTAAKRRELLAEADAEVVASVLAAKPFLSGLKPAEAESLRHKTTRAWFPQEVKRREKLSKAQEQLNAACQTYHKQTAGYIDKQLGEFEKTKSAVDAAVKGEL